MLTTLRNEGSESARVETRRAGIEQARRFAWDGFADSMAAIYMHIARARPRPVYLLRCPVLHVGKFYPPAPGGMERVVQLLCENERPEVDSVVLAANTSPHTVREIWHGVPVTRGRQCRSQLVRSESARRSRQCSRARRAIITVIHEPNPVALVSTGSRVARPAGARRFHSEVVRARGGTTCSIGRSSAAC